MVIEGAQMAEQGDSDSGKPVSERPRPWENVLMTPGIQEGDRVRMTSSAGSTEVEVVSVPSNPIAMVKVRGPNGHELFVPRSDLHAIDREEEGITFHGRSDPRVGGSEDAAFDHGSSERGGR
jgi:hypothetical protein